MTKERSELDAAVPQVSRRQLIRKALVAGGVGYVAPMVLGSATPVFAQAVSGTCTTCQIDNECPQGFSCLARVGASGNQCVFLGSLFCDNFDSCTSDADCSAGYACVTCNTGECMPCTLPG